jgi:hemerythrin
MIQWHESYSIGNERIDFQHHIFLGLVGEFSNARQQGAPAERLGRILEEVIKYAEYHFYSEENLMTDNQYPELARHRILHNHLLSKIRIKSSEMALELTTPKEVEDFLVEWFLLHTQHEDKKISQHIKARQPG